MGNDLTPSWLSCLDAIAARFKITNSLSLLSTSSSLVGLGRADFGTVALILAALRQQRSFAISLPAGTPSYSILLALIAYLDNLIRKAENPLREQTIGLICSSDPRIRRDVLDFYLKDEPIADALQPARLFFNGSIHPLAGKHKNGATPKLLILQPAQGYPLRLPSQVSYAIVDAFTEKDVGCLETTLQWLVNQKIRSVVVIYPLGHRHVESILRKWKILEWSWDWASLELAFLGDQPPDAPSDFTIFSVAQRLASGCKFKHLPLSAPAHEEYLGKAQYYLHEVTKALKGQSTYRIYKARQVLYSLVRMVVPLPLYEHVTATASSPFIQSIQSRLCEIESYQSQDGLSSEQKAAEDSFLPPMLVLLRQAYNAFMVVNPKHERLADFVLERLTEEGFPSIIVFPNRIQESLFRSVFLSKYKITASDLAEKGITTTWYSQHPRIPTAGTIVYPGFWNASYEWQIMSSVADTVTVLSYEFEKKLAESQVNKVISKCMTKGGGQEKRKVLAIISPADMQNRQSVPVDINPPFPSILWESYQSETYTLPNASPTCVLIKPLFDPDDWVSDRDDVDTSETIVTPSVASPKSLTAMAVLIRFSDDSVFYADPKRELEVYLPENGGFHPYQPDLIKPGMVLCITNTQVVERIFQTVRQNLRENPLLQSLVLQLDTWRAYVDEAFLKADQDVSKLHKFLRDNGSTRAEMTVRFWVDGRIMGSYDSADVERIIRYVKGENSQVLAEKIDKSLRKMRSYLQRAGRRLHKRLVEMGHLTLQKELLDENQMIDADLDLYVDDLIAGIEPKVVKSVDKTAVSVPHSLLGRWEKTSAGG